jgi:hypothetical protein
MAGEGDGGEGGEKRGEGKKGREGRQKQLAPKHKNLTPPMSDRE